MTRLSLYMILHGNLGFSSIPKSRYSKVVDCCYWPMVEIMEQGCPIGIEFPAETLLEIERIDSSLLRRIRRLWKNNRCECIASGMTQIIMPLVPFEINRKNLEYGMDIYRSLLGRVPDLCFIPEQTFSKSLAPLFREFGFRGLIMDWDNASEHLPFNPELRYRPALLEIDSKSSIPVLWNSSMNSFKFQRYIYGRIGLRDYLEGLRDHAVSRKSRALCVYGTDWEIFNFRPLTHETATDEHVRVRTVFERAAADPHMDFFLPSTILERLPPRRRIRIDSPRIPVHCKNRDDYNVVRWAVSGRDTPSQNARCFEMYERLKRLESLKENAHPVLWKELIRLWGSDFRTRPTGGKHSDFWMRLGALSQDIRRKTKTRIRPRRRAGSEDILLVRNLSTSDLSNEIAEKRLRFPPGRFHGTPGLSRNGVSLPCQCEDASYYRDGSLRECRMVFPVSLEAGDGFRAQILSDVAPRPREVTVRLNGPEVSVATPRVRLELNLNTGADIRSLEFPDIHPVPLVKYLPPVYFDNIAYSNDYYSGWSQMCTRDGTIFHDTIPTRFLPDPNLFSIRVPVHFLHPFQNGFIRKTYHVYIDHPRVDLVNRFYFPEVTPYFLRTAITTFNPEAFCPEHLAYSTVQGGALPETFMLKGRVVDHTRFPGTRCSAASCLGSAGGWIAVHDRQKGLALLSDRARCYSVPMVEYEEIRNRWLLRLYHSMAETDDTGSVTFRGHNEIRFSYLGFRGGIQNIVPAARTLSGALWVHQAGGAPEEN